MIRSLGFALALLLGVTQAQAQSNFTMPPPAGVMLNGAQVVGSCGAGTLITTNPGYISVDQTGKLCVNASVVATATISGTLSTSPVVITPVSGTGTFIISCNAGCAGSGGTQSTSPTTVTPVTQVTSPRVIAGNVNVQGTVTTSIPGVQQTTVNNTVSTSPVGGPAPVFVTNATSLGQAVMANSSPVVISSNQSVGDPCMFQAKTTSPFFTTAVSSILVPGVSGQLVYVCSMMLIDAAGEGDSIAEGTSGGTSLKAVMGGTAGATGMQFAANGGFTLGGGMGTIAKTTSTASYLLLLKSGTTSASGVIGYVQQ